MVLLGLLEGLLALLLLLPRLLPLALPRLLFSLPALFLPLQPVLVFLALLVQPVLNALLERLLLAPLLLFLLLLALKLRQGDLLTDLPLALLVDVMVPPPVMLFSSGLLRGGLRRLWSILLRFLGSGFIGIGQVARGERGEAGRLRQDVVVAFWVRIVPSSVVLVPVIRFAVDGMSVFSLAPTLLTVLFLLDGHLAFAFCEFATFSELLVSLIGSSKHILELFCWIELV